MIADQRAGLAPIIKTYAVLPLLAEANGRAIAVAAVACRDGCRSCPGDACFDETAVDLDDARAPEPRRLRVRQPIRSWSSASWPCGARFSTSRLARRPGPVAVDAAELQSSMTVPRLTPILAIIWAIPVPGCTSWHARRGIVLRGDRLAPLPAVAAGWTPACTPREVALNRRLASSRRRAAEPTSHRPTGVRLSAHPGHRRGRVHQRLPRARAARGRPRRSSASTTSASTGRSSKSYDEHPRYRFVQGDAKDAALRRGAGRGLRPGGRRRGDDRRHQLLPRVRLRPAGRERADPRVDVRCRDRRASRRPPRADRGHQLVDGLRVVDGLPDAGRRPS